MRGCFMGVVSLVALGMIALTVWFGAGAIFASATTAVPTLVAQVPTVTIPTPALPHPTETVAPRPTAPPVLVQSTDEVELLRLTDSDLTAAIHEALVASPDGPPLSGIEARIMPGRVTLTGSYRGLFVPVPVTVSGRPEVRDGRPHITVESVEGAGMELPETVRQGINAMLQAQDVIPAPEGARITRIDLRQGELVVFGREQAG